MRSLFLISGLAFLGIVLLFAQDAPPAAFTPAQARQALDRALSNELRAAQDSSHPMRYLLRKSTQRLSSTREIYETKDGDVARLLTLNGQALSTDAEQREMARLEELAANPGRQRHRAQAEDADRARAVKILEVLPTAFQYQYTGLGQGPAGPVEKFAFRPNPDFSPPDMETQILVAMAGDIWIDPAQGRVVRLDGRLQRDVGFGWDILGRLNKGGWIAIQQAEVVPGQWRTVKLQMAMSGRVFFKTRSFDTTENESDYALLPALGYRQAIEKLEQAGR